MIEISVIIPMYNSEDTIIDAVESVLRQTYNANKEIIVINDGSVDNSLKVINDYIKNKKFEELIRVIDKKNGGVSSARNLGMKNSKGKYIAFLDSDDKWISNKLEEQMKIFNKDSSVGLVGTTINNKKFTRFFFKKFDYLTEISIKNLVFKNFFQPSTVIITREVINIIGYFDENQRYAEEGNYFMRVANEFKCILINESYLDFGLGKPGFGHSGLSANIVEMEKGELKNLKFAYEEKYINLFIYYIAVFYSILKYIRRYLIKKIYMAGKK